MTAAVDKLLAAGHKVLAVRYDVSEAMVDRTVVEFGRPAAALSNAGAMARIAPTLHLSLLRSSGDQTSEKVPPFCGAGKVELTGDWRREHGKS